MVKKAILAGVIVFVLWSAWDMLVHGFVLSGLYQDTAGLWRPMDEMRAMSGIIHVAVLISSVTFVWIYAQFFRTKNMGTALMYGIMYGLAAGISMGFGTFAVMPIPFRMALIWFLGALGKTITGAVVLGLVVKERASAA